MRDWLRRPGPRRRRRGYAIHGYIGPNGSGKSAAAVWDTLPSLERGRPVLSTVRLLDYNDPRPCDDAGCKHPEHDQGGEVTHRAAHPLWIPWSSWQQLLEVEHCDVIADEITGVASSRESQSMPAMVANALVQLRRRDVIFRWTAPSWARADLIIRECSQAATVCTGFLPVDDHGEDGETDRMWRRRRFFRWLTYDAANMDDLDAGKREHLRPEVIDWHWGPGSVTFAAYDTWDAVSSIGHVSDTGRCMRCGGRRSAPPCSCSDYVQRKRSPRGAEAGGSPRAGSGVAPAADAPHHGAAHDTRGDLDTHGSDTDKVPNKREAEPWQVPLLIGSTIPGLGEHGVTADSHCSHTDG